MNHDDIRDYLGKRIEEIATPIDLDALLETGILQKEGSWYRARDLRALADHARKKIIEIKEDGKAGILVKFESETPY